jgi:endoglucanase Acf2
LLLAVAGCATGGAVGGRGPRGARDPAKTARAGAGWYATALPDGEKGPSNFRGEPVAPKVTTDFAGVPTSNDWWSSLIWRYDFEGKANPYSETMWPHPLALKADRGGVQLAYPDRAEIKPRAFAFPFAPELRVGVEGLAAPDTRVAGYSDWAVTAAWANGATGPRLRATFGHGLPYVYAEVSGGPAMVDLLADGDVVTTADGGATIVVQMARHRWALFAPRGARWTRAARRYTSDLAGKGVFSVAALPDAEPATVALFRAHAFAFPTDTRVSWKVDEATSDVVTSFAVAAEARDAGATAVPLVALYPHQWKATRAKLLAPAFVTPRGTMKLVAADGFETTRRAPGALPILPVLAGVHDAKRLATLLEDEVSFDDPFPAGMENTRGSYWTGKSLQKLALHAWLADAVGATALRDRLVAAVRGELESWFDGAGPELFAYDRTWRTLIGVPSEYRSGWELNDHHFHYGYYLLAAATVARFVPGWGGADRFGPMVELLLRDCANEHRDDERFPFLRYFDPYAGHSWANGPSLFADGNNEESSSEDANFAWAVALWGAITGDRPTRDLGLYLQATVASAVDEYWFDVDHQNFPKGFAKPALGMVWGDGGKYDTWFDRNPIYAHGINFLPVTAGSLYLGRRPDYVRANYDHLVQENRGEILVWREVIWSYLAFAAPDQALELYDADPHFDTEFGGTHALTEHWLHALAALGRVDPDTSADSPHAATFVKNGRRAHVAWNPDAGRSARVRFSDGTVLDVPPGAVKGDAGAGR